ncbi:hypothetical protein [Nocardioides ferulae]|uniref:hypothetical protein n=1 Tax=Nocardioides ferulae TaxID=2340821 RepID=UPI000EB4831C|nr:hypothetical protein [Nocardioides ferulae]
MTWWSVGPVGASRDLWVHVHGDGKPGRGRWVTPAGRDVLKVLRAEGPPGLDVAVHWVQQRDSRGKRPTAMLWQTDLSGFKLVSTDMVEVLRQHCPDLRTFPDLDIRLRNGERVSGYVGVLEPFAVDAPVHSYFSDRRAHRLVVDDDVSRALRSSDLAGLEITEAPGPFPGDLYVDEDD